MHTPTRHALRFLPILFAVVAVSGCSADDPDAKSAIDHESSNNDLTSAESVNVFKSMRPALQTVFAADDKMVVYVPKRLPKSVVRDEHIFAFASTSAEDGKVHYHISFDTTPDCKGANACSLGNVFSRSAKSGFEPNAKIAVTFGAHTETIDVEFDDMSCGASCSPPSLSWKSNLAADFGDAEVIHTIALKGSRADLESAFKSAIRNGPMTSDFEF